jgi:alcohol dehydrogenase class IV
MDALTHNIESYLSPAYHPLCDGIALEGTRIARARCTPRSRAGNLQARSDMMMASMMGAIAFQKDLGAVHSARMRWARCATCTTAWPTR